MITLKVIDIVNAIPVLQELTTKSLRGRTAYMVARLIKEIDKENNTYNESRQALVLKYVQKDENGEPKLNEAGDSYLLQPDKIEEFNKEIEDLLNTEVEVAADKLKLDDLEDAEFTPMQMLTLEPFIRED